MRIILAAVALSLLIPASVMAHDLRQDMRVPAVGVNDKGELLLQQDKFSYKNWNSAQLSGKVRVVQHIAGRSSAKEMNAALIEAIKAAKLPHDRYQTTTIVNTDDAIPGTGMLCAAASRLTSSNIRGRSLLSTARAMCSMPGSYSRAVPPLWCWISRVR